MATGELVPAVAEWLAARRRVCDMRVTEIRRSESNEWRLAADGRIRHRTGAFFSVTGVRVTTGDGRLQELPLIDQPEVGLLGFVVRRRPDGPEVLVQAKPEPGNVGLVQLAPSVQATKSNYQRRHGGKPTVLLDVFSDGSSLAPLSSSLQSEQGSRFLGKYNRNAVVEVGPAWQEPPSDAFRWFRFEELQPMLLSDSVINTDARSVFASAPWSAFVPTGRPFSAWKGQGGFGEQLWRSFGDEAEVEARAASALRRLQGLRERYAFEAASVALDDLESWSVSDESLVHDPGGSFEVRHFGVSSSEREVERWDQPMIASARQGRAVLLCQRRSDVLAFLFTARAEPGFRNHIQLGPTIQSVAGPGEMFGDLESREQDLTALATAGREVASCLHSDEGGRFFNCISRYSVMELDETLAVPEHDTGLWLTLAEIAVLIGRQGVFTNEARSLVSMILAFA